MKRIFALIFIVVSLLFLYQSSNALTITSPKENEIVYAGSQMTVVVKPDPGEEWISVSFGIDPMTYNPFTKEYKITVPVPKDYSGYYDNLFVFAADRNNKSIQLRRTIFVKLPPDVVLQSIEVNPSFILLEKMPAGSAPDDVSAYSTKKLRVNGIYSDAVKRKLSSSAAGTSYVSGNDKVATVDTEGLITAQDIGETAITARNGKYSATVKIVVKPYK